MAQARRPPTWRSRLSWSGLEYGKLSHAAENPGAGARAPESPLLADLWINRPERLILIDSTVKLIIDPEDRAFLEGVPQWSADGLSRLVIVREEEVIEEAVRSAGVGLLPVVIAPFRIERDDWYSFMEKLNQELDKQGFPAFRLLFWADDPEPRLLLRGPSEDLICAWLGAELDLPFRWPDPPLRTAIENWLVSWVEKYPDISAKIRSRPH